MKDRKCVNISVKLCKFILCCVKQCKGKNKFIYIVLHSLIKQCKCIYIYDFTLLYKTM
jgi:hypothetical protein